MSTFLSLTANLSPFDKTFVSFSLSLVSDKLTISTLKSRSVCASSSRTSYINIEIILDKAFSVQHRTVINRKKTILEKVESKTKKLKSSSHKPKYEYVTREVIEQVEVFNGLERHQLRKLLVICTQKSHFQFKGNFFDQIDGVAMGSPLGPLFAEFFMMYFEE